METYVLQFHVFMCRDVQHILVLLPGAHKDDGNPIMAVFNMLVCGSIFLFLAVEARKATVSTQECVISAVKAWEDNVEKETLPEPLGRQQGVE